MINQEKGLVILYTGEGKGKTTAALGIILRAVGYKKKCLMVQFGKHWFTGELTGAKKLAPYVKIIQGGKGFIAILGDRIPKEKHIEAAHKTFDLLYTELVSNKWDIVIADEIVGAISAGVLPLKQAVRLVTDKPKQVDLVLTGHHAPDELIKMADLVTEMKEVKHPYRKGILAKKGVDF